MNRTRKAYGWMLGSRRLKRYTNWSYRAYLQQWTKRPSTTMLSDGFQLGPLVRALFLKCPIIKCYTHNVFQRTGMNSAADHGGLYGTLHEPVFPYSFETLGDPPKSPTDGSRIRLLAYHYSRRHVPIKSYSMGGNLINVAFSERALYDSKWEFPPQQRNSSPHLTFLVCDEEWKPFAPGPEICGARWNNDTPITKG